MKCLSLLALILAGCAALPASTIVTAAGCASANPSSPGPIFNGGGSGVAHADCSVSTFDRGSFRTNTGAADVTETSSLAQTDAHASVYRFAPAFVQTRAEWTETFDVTFFGGSGILWVEPCLSASATPGNEAVASFGGKLISSSSFTQQTCNGFFDGPPLGGTMDGLEFGRTYRFAASLVARTTFNAISPDSYAQAAFLYSFEGWRPIFDGTGGGRLERLENLSWTLEAVEIPEPATLLPVGIALLALAAWKLRRIARARFTAVRYSALP